jgi:SH3-like domain-containing protein
MRLRLGTISTLVTLGLLAAPLYAAWAQQRKPPYYASIAASKARMRTGPGRNYPASWLYQRADLPVKVVEIYNDWRKIEDPDGTQGWMQVALMSSQRTGYVAGGIVELRDAPRGNARINWRAAPGVVGRISKCQRGWCWFDVKGRAGYVEQNRIWGTEPGEEID